MQTTAATGATTNSETRKGAQHVKEDGTIRPLCEELSRKIGAFLDEEVEGEVLKNLQTRTRVALRVIDEALEKYR